MILPFYDLPFRGGIRITHTWWDGGGISSQARHTTYKLVGHQLQPLQCVKCRFFGWDTGNATVSLHSLKTVWCFCAIKQAVTHITVQTAYTALPFT